MRILMTGGAGCLGSNLIERYLPQGHEIAVIDNFATGKRELVPDVKGLHLTEGSIADAALLEGVFERFEPTHVVHSAAAYKDPGDWIEDTATNVTGAINVAQCCSRFGVRRLVNFQTALVYGRPQRVPIRETDAIAPFTSYGISKAAGEQYLFMLAPEVEVVSLRLANICGPRLAIGPIPTFYKRLKEGKSCFCSDTVRDFLDMEDFFTLMDVVLGEAPVSGVYNVSTGAGHSIKDLFDVVCAYLDVDPGEVPVVPPGDDDVPAVVLDPSNVRETLGWSAQVGFRETIERMLRWYDQYGVTDIYTHLAAPTAADP